MTVDARPADCPWTISTSSLDSHHPSARAAVVVESLKPLSKELGLGAREREQACLTYLAIATVMMSDTFGCAAGSLRVTLLVVLPAVYGCKAA